MARPAFTSENLAGDQGSEKQGSIGTDRCARFCEIIAALSKGQCNNPVRVVAFNTDEGWSRDVSDDVADELRERCAQRGAVPDFLLDFLEAHDNGRPIQLPLPMAI
jgi:hypothetical protein